MTSVDRPVARARGMPPAMPVAMSTPRQFRCFDYVNQGFEAVDRTLTKDPISLFGRATAAANGTNEPGHARLHVSLGPLDVATPITLELWAHYKRGRAAGEPRATFDLSWRATRAAAAFPVMDAELLLYPLSGTETQLELVCEYQPPLGVVGNALDAAGLHLLAEQAITRFLREVAERLRLEMRDARSHAARTG